jgi:hypothetical protein
MSLIPWLRCKQKLREETEQRECKWCGLCRQICRRTFRMWDNLPTTHLRDEALVIWGKNYPGYTCKIFEKCDSWSVGTKSRISFSIFESVCLQELVIGVRMYNVGVYHERASCLWKWTLGRGESSMMSACAIRDLYWSSWFNNLPSLILAARIMRFSLALEGRSYCLAHILVIQRSVPQSKAGRDGACSWPLFGCR